MKYTSNDIYSRILLKRSRVKAKHADKQNLPFENVKRHMYFTYLDEINWILTCKNKLQWNAMN